jgi:hypothetical protein
MLLANNAARRARLPIGTLALLLAVFGWGLHYKISLYQDLECSFSSTSVPPAKLLSEAERIQVAKGGATSRISISGSRASSPDALAPAGTHYSKSISHGSSFLLASREVVAERHLSSRQFFIRPPPLTKPLSPHGNV